MKEISVTKPLNFSPIHTMYGGADKFSENVFEKLSSKALEYLENLKENKAFLDILTELFGSLNHRELFDLTTKKLQSNSIEDFRIDFEDGLGLRSDKEESELAKNSANICAELFLANKLPCCIGIRIKSFSDNTKTRAKETLEIFLDNFFTRTKQKIPDNFIITLPKVSASSEISEVVLCLEAAEQMHRLVTNSLRMEILIETPQALLSSTGALSIKDLVLAGQGRIVGAHLGLHDLLSSFNIVPSAQTLQHPFADYARFLMQVSLAGTGVSVVDSITNLIPVVDEQDLEVPRKILVNITHALKQGIYQGWDIHPHQLPLRYLANYAFFLRELPQAKARYENFLKMQGQATKLGSSFDDEATIEGVRKFLERAGEMGIATS